MLSVLVADDDDIVRASIGAALATAGHQVTLAGDGAEAANLLSCHAFDLAICDVVMPNLDGLSLLRRIRREAPHTAVVIMTTFGRIEDVVIAMRDGAVDYVTKPFDTDDFTTRIVQPIAERHALRAKVENAKAQLGARATGATIVAVSASMRHVLDRAAMLAHADASVLISGERGTGKELVARTIHALGPRREGPFVLIEGVEVADMILATEYGLIGHADTRHDAWFRNATGGTLVIDGIDALSLKTQAMLLRMMEEPGAPARRTATWQPLGVRVIGITQRKLAERVAAGSFIESLFYRLSGAQLHVPALRERGDDLCALVLHLLREITPPGRTAPALTPAAWSALSAYAYPGNVRELGCALDRAMTNADGDAIDVAHLPSEMRPRYLASAQHRNPVE